MEDISQVGCSNLQNVHTSQRHTICGPKCSLFQAQDAVDDGLKLLGLDPVPGPVEGVGHHVGVGHVKFAEHLPYLVVPKVTSARLTTR
jgi:hypothetical protein